MKVNKTPARSRLLRAADRMLFTRGVQATPVDELLREAETSAATLYAQFGSKDGLLAKALEGRLSHWQAVWDSHIVEATDDTARLLAIFDALLDYRDGSRSSARWCAFLATASELSAPPESVLAVLEADSALLRKRLLHLSEPLAGERAHELADAVELIYSGALASFLRGEPLDPIAVGRRTAAVVVASFGS